MRRSLFYWAARFAAAKTQPFLLYGTSALQKMRKADIFRSKEVFAMGLRLHIFLLCMMLWWGNGQACTTMLVTKGASADGSVMITHSDDNAIGDQRIVYVPAKDHATGTKRAVCADGYQYPRATPKGRAAAYDITAAEPLGYIDEAPHTYAYFDGNYGIMNEHQLMVGECTNNAKVMSKKDPKCRIMHSNELSRIALERCKTAREAVILAGSLLEKYGYFGTGETLLFGDTEEGWVMEMCSSPDGTGGLWVAKKVPDGQVFAAANQFRIREVELNNPDFLYSMKLFQSAVDYGWWDGQGSLDWTKAVSNGEYNHPYYSLRRIWIVFRRINPSLNFSPWVKDAFTKEYPFSIVPEKKLSVSDMMRIHRDHYEGTEFDMTKGTAAGPFGSPTRCIGKTDLSFKMHPPEKIPQGAWERPVCAVTTGYTYITQARKNLPAAIGGIAWIGFGIPHATCFMPFYAGVSELPESFQYGSVKKLDKAFAYWPFTLVANQTDLKYSVFIKDVQEKQNELEGKYLSATAEVDKKALELYKRNPAEAKKFLTEYCFKNAGNTIAEWLKLSESLTVKYNSGYANGNEAAYPSEWLNKTSYGKGPVTYSKPK